MKNLPRSDQVKFVLSQILVVNDTYGHTKGDWLINFIASSIEASVREIDAVSRMGGDEFLIIFPNCYESDAEKVVKRIGEKLDEYDKRVQFLLKHPLAMESSKLLEIVN